MAPRRRSAATQEEEIESTSVDADLANVEKSTALGESDVITRDAVAVALYERVKNIRSI